MTYQPLVRTLALVLAGWFGLLAGCASKPTIRVDRNPTADFSNYRTFGFFQPLGTDRTGYQSILSDRLKAATQPKLESLGYQYASGSPDLLVNFGARLDTQLRVTTAPVMGPPMGYGYYGYRAGYYTG